MFMPLGCFLRMLWGRGVVVSTATGLAVSAMIETTQITGVWGIYPCPYRVFDVDDLLANTSGALLGAVLVSLLLQLRSRLLPAPIAAPSDISGVSERISLGRRVTGMVCDVLAVLLLAVAVAVLSNAWQMHLGRTGEQIDAELTQRIAVWVPLLALGLLTLVSGRTVGDFAVRIRFTSATTPGPAALPHRLLRYAGGIGAYQLVDLLPGVLNMFAAAVLVLGRLIAVAAMGSRAGLPSLVGAGTPQDDAPQPQPR
ncbi:VanZ family protein [Nesterenkonia lacusekhoensis]|nr:VanZ family protein [Nesterenkonia lacusekhoensis]